MSASWALQQAVFTALTADTGLHNLCANRVFDAVPKTAAFPYVVIGDAAESATGTAAVEHTLSLHLWSRGGGSREIKQLAAAVRTVLDGAALSLSGIVLIDLAFIAADYSRQSDGETWRGTMRFRAVTEASE